MLYGKYSTKRAGERQIYLPRAIFHLETTLLVLYFAYSMSEGSAFSGIENCQLEIHTRHTKQLETQGVVLSLVE